MADPRTVLTFAIPLPPRALSPNARVHWGARKKAVEDYRADAAWAALQVINRLGLAKPVFERARIAYTIIVRRQPGRYLPRDDDNAIAALKAAQDGFKDAGAYKDDNHGRVTVDPPTFARPKRGEKANGVHVMISELAGAARKESTNA